MELRHLRYFVTTAELGSISRAAIKLFIAQPPLSAQIRQLEEEVGTALLVRLPRGVRLTPAGQSFLQDARAILARAEQAKVRARELRDGQRATVRVGLVPTVTQSLLPGLIQLFQDAGLATRVEGQELVPSSRQLQAIRNAELDIGFIRPGSTSHRDEQVCAIDDPYCVAFPRGHGLARSSGALRVGALEKEVFVAFSRYTESDYFDQTAAVCEASGFKADVRHTATQFMSVLAMVAHGLGVAIVPASCALMIGEGVVLRRLKSVERKSELVLVAGTDFRSDLWGERVTKLAGQALMDFGARLKQLNVWR
ncbi:LysR substrate-binding domain-containing protein [Hydrogenophaga flava]|uniref:LysR substrate-binding domain-containing protein n=1 Tax=Hydrogenophaga flava TaxID=65657 RepID=UPI000824B63A|nr:LysR substrate-binding domain-containing protein [Hydrogenophaga flava]